MREDDPQLAQLEALARDGAGGDTAWRINLHFALAKAYADLKRFDAAFEHMQHGNALKHSIIAYDEPMQLDEMAGLAARYDRAEMEKWHDAGNPSDLPVFVVGMPRSGTTLVEQILASHPDAAGIGETLYFGQSIGPEAPDARTSSDAQISTAEAWQRIATRHLDKLRDAAPQAKRVIDKQIKNALLLGPIHLALPGAKIVHIKRDPLDTCFSCYGLHFKKGIDFAYDFGELGRYYRAFDALMAHWRGVLPPEAMLEVDYESLVTDFESQARRIVEFCGLDWREECLSFHTAKRAINTASVLQVRKPVYTSSIGRWKPYRAHLGALIEALGPLAKV